MGTSPARFRIKQGVTAASLAIVTPCYIVTPAYVPGHKVVLRGRSLTGVAPRGIMDVWPGHQVLATVKH